jgi:hypothetical protein
MNTAPLEAFLAKIYTDEAARERFLADPQAEAQRAGLSAAEAEALAAIDRVGLELNVRSLTRKRERPVPFTLVLLAFANGIPTNNIGNIGFQHQQNSAHVVTTH